MDDRSGMSFRRSIEFDESVSYYIDILEHRGQRDRPTGSNDRRRYMPKVLDRRFWVALSFKIL